jgi:AI-2 transport protein TqsA
LLLYNYEMITKKDQEPQKNKIIYDFYVYSFVKLTCADKRVDLKEKIQVKGFIRNEFPKELQEQYYGKYLESLCQPFVEEKYLEILQLLKEQDLLSSSEKRRFLSNLAQIAKSNKGRLDNRDYLEIISIGEAIGIEDIESDGIIESVFGATDTFIAIIGTLCIGAFLYFAQSLLIPLFLAFFLSRVVNKEEEILTRVFFKKNTNVLTKITAVISTFLIISLIFFVGVKTTINTVNQFPTDEEGIAKVVDDIYVKVAAITKMDAKKIKKIIPPIDKIPVKKIIDYFLSGLSDIFSIIGLLLLVLVFSAFMVFSNIHYHGVVLEMDAKITSYISVKFLISLMVGILFYLVGVVFGLKFPLFWAFLSFLFNFIPAIGSILATLPPAIFAFALFPYQKAILLTVILILVENFFGNFLEPILFGRSLRLNPITVLVGLLFWGGLWGIPGMLMSAPLMAMVKLIAENQRFSSKIARYL